VLADISRQLHDRQPLELRQSRLLRSLATGLRLPFAILLEVSENQKDLRETICFHDGQIESRGDAPDAGEVDRQYRETSDLLLWIQQNQEPFCFAAAFIDLDARRHGEWAESSSGESAPGLDNRFRRANPWLDTPEHAPGVWLPIFSADNRQVRYIISLGGLRIAPSETAAELVFFRTVMNLARVIFTVDA
jgi:hypothetical protein